MKISQMTNDQAAQTLIDLSEPIGRICDDEEALALVDEYRRNSRRPLFYQVGRIIPKLTAHLVRTHKQDAYQIVSILSGKSVDDIGGMKLADTIAIFKESYDDILAGFFTSSAAAITDGGKK